VRDESLMTFLDDIKKIFLDDIKKIFLDDIKKKYLLLQIYLLIPRVSQSCG